MKKKKTGLSLSILLTVLIACSLIVTGYTTPATGAVTLKGVSFLPPFVDVVRYTGVFSKRVTERSKGELSLKWVGGGEVIPMFDQDDALTAGTIDFAGLTISFYVDKIPAGRSMPLSRLTPLEERQSGYFDFMNKLHKEHGMVYLGRINNEPFYYALNKRISRPQEFSGLKIGSSALFNDFLLAMGAVPVDAPEEYAALQRKVIEGSGSSGIENITGRSWHEVAPYIVDHGFYQADVLMLMSLKAWERLNKKQHELIEQVMIEIEKEQAAFFADAGKKARKIVLDAGGGFIKFSPSDAKWYIDRAYDSKWKALRKTLDAETYAKIRKLLREP
jgi:TRAP-type C4-dicarboxylate transport system substrate-binding protein